MKKKKQKNIKNNHLTENALTAEEKGTKVMNVRRK